MKKNTKFLKRTPKHLVVALILLSATLLVYFFLSNFSNKNQKSKTENAITAYRVEIQDNSQDPFGPVEMYQYIFGTDMMNEEDPRGIFTGLDSTLPEHRSTFYVLANQEHFKDKKQFETSTKNIIRVQEDPKLIPFLKDPKYCQSNQDCVSESKFCQFGSYNQYRYYALYGCGGYTGYEGITDEQIKQSSCPDSFWPVMIESRCVDNQCQATKTDLRCEPD